ncbi:hypothetical protein DRN46_05230 [Thermococci archaeon]|nr:MAG: hypothetical protein DRN46_05230 [Thermococci archaeon]
MEGEVRNMEKEEVERIKELAKEMRKLSRSKGYEIVGIALLTEKDGEHMVLIELPDGKGESITIGSALVSSIMQNIKEEHGTEALSEVMSNIMGDHGEALVEVIGQVLEEIRKEEAEEEKEYV